MKFQIVHNSSQTEATLSVQIPKAILDAPEEFRRKVTEPYEEQGRQLYGERKRVENPGAVKFAAIPPNNQPPKGADG